MASTVKPDLDHASAGRLLCPVPCIHLQKGHARARHTRDLNRIHNQKDAEKLSVARPSTLGAPDLLLVARGVIIVGTAITVAVWAGTWEFVYA